MNVSLTPQQQEWLDTHIAQGDFASVDDAVRQLIDERMTFETDDLAWAKPYVDEALAELERGEVVSWEDYKKQISEHMDNLRRLSND